MFQQDGSGKLGADTHANLKEHLHTKTAEELEEELDAIFEREECEGVEADPKVVFEYYKAIEALKQNEEPQTPGSFQESWATFTKNHPDLFPKEERKPRTRRLPLRHVVEAAVLLAILLALAVSASGVDWPDYIIMLGKEILQIAPSESESGVMELAEPNENGYTSLENAVADLGTTQNVRIIDWVPERFSIQSISFKETEIYTTVLAVFKSEKSELVIRISYYFDKNEMPDLAFEQNRDERQSIYKFADIEHLFSENFNRVQAVWKNGNIFYSVSGEVTREEMERMVNSTYGG